MARHRYRIEYRRSEFTEFEVTAATEDEARDIAEDTWDMQGTEIDVDIQVYDFGEDDEDETPET